MKARKFTARFVDLEQLLDLVGGDVDLLREVAELGASDVSRLLDALEAAPSAGEMAPIAHELKGLLLNLTAISAARCAASVEAAAKSGNERGAREEFARARGTLDDVVATLTSVAHESRQAAS